MSGFDQQQPGYDAGDLHAVRRRIDRAIERAEAELAVAQALLELQQNEITTILSDAFRRISRWLSLLE